MVQQFHSYFFTQNKWKLMFTERLEQECSLQLTHIRNNEWKTAQVSISSKLDKQVVCSRNGIIVSDKKEWTTDTQNNMDELLKYYAQRKNPVPKEDMLHDSIFMNFKNRQTEGGGRRWRKSKTRRSPSFPQIQ